MWTELLVCLNKRVLIGSDFPENQRAAFRFLQISTDEVYGSLGPSEPPFSESSPYAPNSPYRASKAASDHLVRVTITPTDCRMISCAKSGGSLPGGRQRKVGRWKGLCVLYTSITLMQTVKNRLCSFRFSGAVASIKSN